MYVCSWILKTGRRKSLRCSGRGTYLLFSSFLAGKRGLNAIDAIQTVCLDQTYAPDAHQT